MDTSNVPVDAHGCPGCPHNCTGPATLGSNDVFVNGRPAIRVTDTGVHMACCNGNLWTAKTGSATVFINNLKAHRKGDMDQHCGGMGTMKDGSDDVITGG